MIDTIKSEIEELQKVQKSKLEYLQNVRNILAQTEAEIHQLNGAIAMGEKLLAAQSASVENAPKIK